MLVDSTNNSRWKDEDKVVVVVVLLLVVSVLDALDAVLLVVVVVVIVVAKQKAEDTYNTHTNSHSSWCASHPNARISVGEFPFAWLGWRTVQTVGWAHSIGSNYAESGGIGNVYYTIL